MIRVKIQSDKGVCKIKDADTGEVIKGISRIDIDHDVGSLPIIELTIVNVDPGQYEVEGEASFLVHSTTNGEMKRVKQIEFEDGEIINYGGTE